MIPVAISYERLFEIRNIATENMSGEVGDLKLLDVHKMVKESGQNQQLGKCFISLCEPIDL